MAVRTPAELLAEINTIRNETSPAANSRSRVADCLQNIADSTSADLTYATPAEFRASAPPADGTFFKLITPPGEYRYSSSSGAGFADDGKTILKPDSILVGANGRAFSTRAGATVPTFDALRGLKGSNQDHVHVQAHTSFGDGGGGIFDRADIGSYVDDGGTIATAGSNAWVRRGCEVGPVMLAWWGQNGTDDTVAFTRALAYSVGVTYADWVAGGGDTSWVITHRSRPVQYSGLVTLTSRVTIRYRNVQIQGPTKFGDGFVVGPDKIIADHDDHAFVIDTGTTTYYVPSLTLTDAIIERASGHSSCLDGIYLDGSNWFYGLILERSGVGGHRSGIGVSATYRAGEGIASGLRLNRSSLSGNREYGIDSGTAVQWDLSEIRNSGLNHNTLGPCLIRIAGGSIERVDIEGGGGGGYIVGRGARIGHLYCEQAGPTSAPAITIRAIDRTEVIACTNADSRAAALKIQYSENSRINDRTPVRCDGVNNCEIPGGWSPPSAAAHGMFSAVDSCSQPYLRRVPLISGATSVTMYDDPSVFTGTTDYDGKHIPSVEVGVPSAELGYLKITVPGTFTAGRAYVLAYCVRYGDDVPAGDSHVVVTGVGTYDVSMTVHIGVTKQIQNWIMFTPGTTVTGRELYVYPYGQDASATGYGARVSAVLVADVTGVTKVEQLHVPTLIEAVRASDYVPDVFHQSDATVSLVALTPTEVDRTLLTGLTASTNYIATLESRVTLWETATPTNCGAVDEVIDLHVAVDSDGVATCTIVGTQLPDASRLPAGLAGASMSVVPITGGISIQATAPDLACSGRSRLSISKFEVLA